MIRKPEFGRRTRKIPVIGIRQVGKTYFFFTLANIIGEKGWGLVEVDDPTYFGKLLQRVFKAEPIDPTMEREPIKLIINKVEVGEESIPCNFCVYTEDYGGAEFEQIMDRLSKREDLRPDQQDLLNAFTNLIRDVDGVIIIIDVIRRIDDRGNLVTVTADDFEKNRDEFILSSLSYQVVPLTEAIDMLIKKNPKVKGKPIFLVVTKSDVHRMNKAEIEKHFSRLMAINLARLRSRGFIIKWYSVASYGFGEKKIESLLTQFGFNELLHDIADFLGRRR